MMTMELNKFLEPSAVDAGSSTAGSMSQIGGGSLHDR